jgi:HTH-type transcriptional regulator / antitoxin HigA
MDKNLKQYTFKPDYAVPPGETLKETMEFLRMSQREMAIRTGLTVQTLNRIFTGEQSISYETANKLELVTGVKARFWNSLEAQYREDIARLSEKEQLNADLDWLKIIPTKDLIKRGYIKNSTDKVELLRETLKFYGVSSVSAWNSLWDNPKVAARRSKCFNSHPGAASAWIRTGEIKAISIKCNKYDKKVFLAILQDLRLLTLEGPETSLPKLQKNCARAGVAVVFVPEFKKVPWNGATKWLSPDKAMVLLNLRGKGEDHFWFSFFHEAWHILHDQKKFLSINDDSKDSKEISADEFAAEILIPYRFNAIISGIKSKQGIIDFAKTLKVSPGIVAGRYHHLTKKWNWYNGLIRKFQWTN